MGLLFTYLLTYGGAALSLVRPFYGLLAYICFAIIKPEALWHWSVPAGNYSRIVAIALLIGWALNGFGNWKLGSAKAVVWAIAGFWIWAAFSSTTCENQDKALAFLETKGKIVLPVIVGLTLIETRQHLKQLAWTIALSQGYVAYDLNRSFWDGFNRLHEYGFGGMDNNSMTIGLVAGVGLAFFLGLAETVRWKQLLAWACAAFMAHAVFFSFSRGGMTGLCVVGAATLYLLPKTPKLMGLFAVGAGLALMMAGPEVLERFYSSFSDSEDRDASAQSRVELWSICIDMTASNPVLGVGPDHFPLHVGRYGGGAKSGMSFDQGKEAHTLWLQTSAELGVPGLAFLLSFYLLTVAGLFRIRKDQRHSLVHSDQFLLYIPAMVCASLAGFMFSAQFVSLEGLELPYYITLLGAGLMKIYSPALEPAGEMVEQSAPVAFPRYLIVGPAARRPSESSPQYSQANTQE